MTAMTMTPTTRPGWARVFKPLRDVRLWLRLFLATVAVWGLFNSTGISVIAAAKYAFAATYRDLEMYISQIGPMGYYALLGTGIFGGLSLLMVLDLTMGARVVKHLSGLFWVVLGGFLASAGVLYWQSQQASAVITARNFVPLAFLLLGFFGWLGILAYVSRAFLRGVGHAGRIVVVGLTATSGFIVWATLPSWANITSMIDWGRICLWLAFMFGLYKADFDRYGDGARTVITDEAERHGHHDLGHQGDTDGHHG